MTNMTSFQWMKKMKNLITLINVLRGARWLFQRAEGEELDDDEDSDLDEDEDEEPERVEVEPRAPVDYIVEKLVQRGVTMADLVKSILIRDHEEYQFHDEFDRADDELFGKFRIIISNYQPPAPEPVSLLEDQAPVLENNNADETVLTVREAMNLIHRGPIPRGLVVSSNDPDYRKFKRKSRCDMFFTVRAL